MTPDKRIEEKWEEEFDKEFNFNVYECIAENKFRLIDETVKSFIRKLFLSYRQEVVDDIKKVIEGKKKKGNIGTSGTSYNIALSDVLSSLTLNEKEHE